MGSLLAVVTVHQTGVVLGATLGGKFVLVLLPERFPCKMFVMQAWECQTMALVLDERSKNHLNAAGDVGWELVQLIEAKP